MPLIKKKKSDVLVTVVPVRFKARTVRMLVRAAKAYGSPNISDFVRTLIEVNIEGDLVKAQEFSRRLAGGVGEQLFLERVEAMDSGKKARR